MAYGGERGHVMAQPWFSSAAGGEVVEVAKAAGSIGQQVCADTAPTRSAGSPTATPPAQRGNCGRSAVARPRRPARRAWSSGLAHCRSTAAEDGAPITKRDAAEPVRYQPRRSATSAANSRPTPKSSCRPAEQRYRPGLASSRRGWATGALPRSQAMPKPVKTAAYKRPRIHSGDGRPLAEQEVEEPDEHRDDADGEAGEQEGGGQGCSVPRSFSSACGAGFPGLQHGWRVQRPPRYTLGVCESGYYSDAKLGISDPCVIQRNEE